MLARQKECKSNHSLDFHKQTNELAISEYFSIEDGLAIREFPRRTLVSEYQQIDQQHRDPIFQFLAKTSYAKQGQVLR